MTMLSDTVSVEELLFRVEGMHCIKCIRKIQTIASKFKSLKRVNVNLGEHLVTAEATEDFPLKEFLEDVREEGFKIKPLANSTKLDVKKNQRSLLMRIGVAGACAGNIMLLAIADYTGASISGFPYIFTYLSFFIFLPVITYSAWPLYESASASIKARKVSIDSPIVLALLGGAALSVYNLASGSGVTYFDSLSMFVFFLMASRFIVQKIQTRYVGGISTKDIFSQSRIELVGTTGSKMAKVQDVKVGDVVRVEKGAYIGFDGELKSKSALIDDALYSGEFLPKARKMLDRVYAGSKNMGNPIEFKVLKTLKQSRISELIENLNVSLNARTSLQSLADKGAEWLTYSILAAAFIILGYFSFFNLEEGLNRVLALLVVACPCGLAIAAPLAQTLGVKRALKNKLLIKNVEIFESLQKVKNVIFDKTGTLTLGEIEVSDVKPREMTNFEKDLIYNLEKESEHPLAFALKKHTGERVSLDLKNKVEVVGKGVSCSYLGDEYSIESDKYGQDHLLFKKNNEEILSIETEDKLDPKAKRMVDLLKEKGLGVYILSGDKKEKALSVGSFVGIEKNNVYFEQSPQSKEVFVKEELKDVLYIGDGVNDSLAMSHSLASVSMTASADIAYKSSQVHMLSKGIGALKNLFELSGLVSATMKKIILISVIYNIIFAVIASFGFISPLIAVIIMPLSSISITFLGFYLMTRAKEGLK